MVETAQHLRSATADLQQSSRAVTIFLPPDLHADLQGLAKENERSLSAQIRFLVKEYVTESERYG
jgi:hypothetical protein